MKLFTTALAALASTVLAAPDAVIYTYDTTPSAAPQSIPTISPQNARLVLFNHMGYAPYTSLNGVDDDTLAILAASPWQQPLFSTAAESKKKVVLLIHGVKDVQDVLSDEEGRRRQIASLDEIPPKRADVLFTQELLNGQMALGLDFEICSADMLKPFSFVQGGWKNTEVFDPCILFDEEQSSEDKAKGEIELLADHFKQRRESNLDAYRIALPKDNKHYKGAASATSAMIKNLVKTSALAQQDVLIVVVPAEAKISKTANWGPASQLIHKRANEKPLSSHESTAPVRPVMPMASSNMSQVRTTMERCSKDEKTCKSRTNSCSGHGKCSRKFSNDNGECWVCQCTSTKEKFGRQYWGGPACQKKDISVQFWLLAGFAIFITSAVTWGIGLLYSMGSVELPSVLSAGVAPTGRK